MNILLVEDDERAASFIVKGLKEAGYTTVHQSNGKDGLDMAIVDEFDAAVIDIMLPGLDGLSLIDEMRKRKVMTPVIILSAKNTVDDRVKGLQAGGDDYLVKPFSFAELLARIQALIRRNYSEPLPSMLVVGDLTLDIFKRKVHRSGCAIELQPREFALLEYLMHNAGRVVSKTMIMEHVWEYNFDPQTNIVEARISRLRDKIDRPFATRLIHTMRGVGYVIEEH